MPYADVEKALVAWLPSHIGNPGEFLGRVVTELPDQFEEQLPVVQVARIPLGGDRVISFDDAVVDIEVYEANRGLALQLAEKVRTAMRTKLLGQTVNGAVFARVRCSSGPAMRPYGNNAVRRAGATYDVTVHSSP